MVNSAPVILSLKVLPLLCAAEQFCNLPGQQPPPPFGREWAGRRPPADPT